MTAADDITPERIVELRRQHREHHRSDILHGRCTYCLDEWPCSVIALLDALEEARIVGDIFADVVRQRDQLRAENARLRAMVIKERGLHRWHMAQLVGDAFIPDWRMNEAFPPLDSELLTAALAASPEQEGQR